MTNWQVLPGLVEYKKALMIMEQKLEQIIVDGGEDTIYLLEHQDVYTAGTGANDDELIDKTSVPVVHVGRGGKYTYHGPGQRVIYPIIDLRKPPRERDLKLYVRFLEKWIISTLRRFDIECYTIPGKVGIWTDIDNTDDKFHSLSMSAKKIPAKIGAIGIRVRKWVTYHGIAVNISNDLSMYEGIIPCGISDFPVTSMYDLGQKISLDDFDLALKEEYLKLFQNNWHDQ